jgi:hypothetical protein
MSHRRVKAVGSNHDSSYIDDDDYLEEEGGEEELTPDQKGCSSLLVYFESV